MLNLLAIALFQVASFLPSATPAPSNSTINNTGIIGSGGWGGDFATIGSGGWGGDIAPIGSGGWGGDFAAV
ncbi:hypothetical protein BEN47_14805 [Hymenobacter lapidarius]|uniref:Uncharacterized protein n=1 Tax=Hymenobacter lapidarius TaxID=1908237 RepID=A0A1G1T3P3_9BACT|nr:hypothetical protein [Hymenobacter lapidarius]OGX85474.1 hypothetical protein BEN47_14805 [Hymenobacter lapidarius]